MVAPDKLDYSPSSGGSAKSKFDHEAPREHDGRDGSATCFRPYEASEEQRAKFERLNSPHEEERSADQTKVRHVEVKRDAHTLASQLDLTDAQVQRVFYLIEQHDGEQKYESVILAAISLAANEDDRAIRREVQWSGIRESYQVTTSALWSARESMRSHL